MVALRSLGMNDWAVRVNRACMPMARSRVRVNGQCIGKFNVGVDVHQGSVLNNLLSILVIEAVYHVFHTGVIRNSSTQMSLSLWQAQRWSVLGVPRPWRNEWKIRDSAWTFLTQSSWSQVRLLRYVYVIKCSSLMTSALMEGGVLSHNWSPYGLVLLFGWQEVWGEGIYLLKTSEGIQRQSLAYKVF